MQLQGHVLTLNRYVGHACGAWSLAAGVLTLVLPQQAFDISLGSEL